MPPMHPYERDWLETLPDIRLVATDLDGTLLGPDHALPDGFWQILERLENRGVLFCAASGRQYWNIRELFLPKSDRMLIAAENGTLVMRGDEAISLAPLPLEEARDLVGLGRRIPDAHVLLCGRRSAWLEDTDERFLAAVRSYYHRVEIVPDLSEARDDILKVTFCDFRGAEEHVLPHLRQLGSRYQVAIAGIPWLDITRRDANKGEALKAIQSRHGIGRHQTMAFGDFLNDIQMLEQAAWSFAMPDAHPQVLETARFTSSLGPDRGGVLDILERTILRGS